MLVTQFDKFVNRSTREILGDEIVQENLVPMLSTDIDRNAGAVTGVKGEKEINYRTGNVNLTPSDLGALDEENVYNGLDQTEAGYALDARQGKTLNDAIDNKLDKANVYNGLDQTEAGYALDARQGKTLNDAIDNKLDKANVYNGLDQTEAGYALDARQGKMLNDKITALIKTKIIKFSDLSNSNTTKYYIQLTSNAISTINDNATIVLGAYIVYWSLMGHNILAVAGDDESAGLNGPLNLLFSRGTTFTDGTVVIMFVYM